MYFGSSPKNASTSRAISSSIFDNCSTLDMSFTNSMSSSFSKRLLFDDKNSNSFFQVASSKEVTVANPYQKLFMKEILSYDDDFSKLSDQETEESNSCFRSAPSEGKISCPKEMMDLEHFPRGVLSNSTTLLDRFDCSRSPSPQKRLNKEQVAIQVKHEKNFSTPVKRQYRAEAKERKSSSDFVDFKAKKRHEGIARLTSDFEILEVKIKFSAVLMSN